MITTIKEFTNENVMLKRPKGNQFDVTKSANSIAAKLEPLFQHMDSMDFMTLKNKFQAILEDPSTHASEQTRKKWLDTLKTINGKNRLMQVLGNLYLAGANMKVESNMSMSSNLQTEKISDWYIKNYPTDKLGQELNDITFEELWNAFNTDNIYDVIGVADSVIRERLFEQLAQIYGVSYDTVYYKWLGNANIKTNESWVEIDNAYKEYLVSFTPGGGWESNPNSEPLSFEEWMKEFCFAPTLHSDIEEIQEGKNIPTLSDENDEVYEEARELFYKEYEYFLREVTPKLEKILSKIDKEDEHDESVIINNLLTHIQYPSNLNVYKLNLFR